MQKYTQYKHFTDQVNIWSKNVPYTAILLGI